jgi:hypothetical protein
VVRGQQRLDQRPLGVGDRRRPVVLDDPAQQIAVSGTMTGVRRQKEEGMRNSCDPTDLALL